MNYNFDHVSRMAAPTDNVAIATRRLAAGDGVIRGAEGWPVSHSLLEGHRFAIAPIAAGQPLLSWGLPFGTALRDLVPGEYVCNELMLAALRQRRLEFPLPPEPNFKDHFARFELDESAFRPGVQVAAASAKRVFDGFARGGGRGAGTRNYIVILGTSSLTATVARALADKFPDISRDGANIDGVVAVAHTEGGGASRPNNFDLVRRTLAGFMVHPNVGAVLALDAGHEAVTNATLQNFLRDHGYPLDAVPHRFLSLGRDTNQALREGEAIIRSWLEPVNRCVRQPLPVAHLKVALQCGGSDAFSGVSGNPLAGWVGKEILRHGGAANLAETSELIGAESYVLQNVRDLETARAFLERVDRFQEWARWHGHSAEGNPSGGNLFRGLYNIVIKSIGAARKRDPDVRLDQIIEYGQLMHAPGFYFMDSPGNDLESIAGQVAAGCNLIQFITGNGSITNFPFVPTIKIVTTTARYELLEKEMDVNAGRYLDGERLEELGAETFEFALEIASGRKSAGERAGHSQVQLWREWRQTAASQREQLQRAPKPAGKAIGIQGKSLLIPGAASELKAFRTASDWACDRVGLIVPTSLCSGQIARLMAEQLNSSRGARSHVSRYVALAHTEGCGVSRGESERLYLRTMIGYLRHPFVQHALLLEHGCEKTHNDEVRAFMAEAGLDPARFGWASVQLDGGIDKVIAKVRRWFAERAANDRASTRQPVGMENLRLGLTAEVAARAFDDPLSPSLSPSDGERVPVPGSTSVPVSASVAAGCAQLVQWIVSAGGTVVVPQNAALLASPEFAQTLGLASIPAPSLAYGEAFCARGFHIMETPTEHFLETITGLGATGVEVMLAHVVENPLQTHPMIPLLYAASEGKAWTGTETGVDLRLAEESPEKIAGRMLQTILRTASGEITPKLAAQGLVEFQMTRGWVGASL